MLIDAHAHLAQAADPVARMAELRAQGFVASIQGGVGPEDWRAQLGLAQHAPGFFRPVLGLHPWWVLERPPETREADCSAALDVLQGLLKKGQGIVALGELGLDFFRDPSKDLSGVQRRVFERQLGMALESGLPLVLHVVHAHEVALEILRRQAPLRGLVHAFSGSYETAQGYLGLGLKLSIGPGIAVPGRFKQLKAALPRLKPSDWVLESDGEGPELLQAARAAAGLTGREVAEVLETSAKTLQGLFF